MATHTSTSQRSSERSFAIMANRWVYWLSSHWLLTFSLLFGLYVSLPFLAPLLMRLGLEFPARAIYGIYSFLCHQLPQRSFFLFGPQITYPLVDIQAVWGDSTNLLVLRRFIGSAEIGWKVAWSDRMVSMFTATLIFAWIWYPLRRRLPRLGWQGLLLLLLPMAVDGFSHMASDLSGVGLGFRDANLWLVDLTGRSLPAAFYAGDGWGSFNSLMRLLTGLLFGAGLVWFGFPYLDEFFADSKNQIQQKFRRAGIPLEAR